MRPLLTLLLSSMLAACVNVSWSRADGTDDDLYRDRGQCQAQALSATNSVIRQADIFEACMRGKGWYKTVTRR